MACGKRDKAADEKRGSLLTLLQQWRVSVASTAGISDTQLFLRRTTIPHHFIVYLNNQFTTGHNRNHELASLCEPGHRNYVGSVKYKYYGAFRIHSNSLIISFSLFYSLLLPFSSLVASFLPSLFSFSLFFSVFFFIFLHL